LKKITNWKLLKMDTNNIYEDDFLELDSIIKNIPADIDAYTSHSLEISEYISIVLGERTQKFLADKLNKSEAEISKLLSGTQNITLKTISKLETALSINIINPRIKEVVMESLNKGSYTMPYKNENLGKPTEFEHLKVIQGRAVTINVQLEQKQLINFM